MTSISAIVITPDALGTVMRTLDCLRAQTVHDELEVVLVGPEAAVREAEAAGVARAFGGFRSVGIGDLALTSEARAAGIRAATSPVVVLTEDHCWPEPEWAEALLRAHRGGDTVVGPAVVNANPHTVLSWANFLVEYLGVDVPVQHDDGRAPAGTQQFVHARRPDGSRSGPGSPARGRKPAALAPARGGRPAFSRPGMPSPGT